MIRKRLVALFSALALVATLAISGVSATACGQTARSKSTPAQPLELWPVETSTVQLPGTRPSRSQNESATTGTGIVALHLDDVEVRKALELLSREGSLHILVSPGVTGRVTANLQGLRPVDALDAILKLCGLVARREKNLTYVYTSDEARQLDDVSRKTATRVYHLNYVRGKDLEGMITPFLSGEGKVAISPGSETGIKSNTDNAGGDSAAGGDVVIVQDYESTLKTIDQIVVELDTQPIQVLIEAVILQLELQDSTDLGVNFAVLDGAGRVLTAIGNGAEINAAAGFTPNELLVAGTGNLKGEPIQKPTGGFAADTHGIKFGFVDDDVTGFIRALERLGDTEVLASPRLLVLNKQRAELIIGDRIGYKTLTVTETAAVEKVEFLNVGTQLRLRPFVARDRMIRMEIHPERSTGSVDEKGLPQTSTSEVTTNVIVPDGSTIVIGGLLQDERSDAQSGVPLISRLRWVGALFRQKSTQTRKRELVVLLTPRIYTPDEPCEIPPEWAKKLPPNTIKQTIRGQEPVTPIRQTSSKPARAESKQSSTVGPAEATARGASDAILVLPDKRVPVNKRAR